MPDITPRLNENQQTPSLAPPGGDPVRAEKYVNQLIQLVNEHKILVDHTDLAKFDPSSLQNHFSLDLKEYKVEISHSKHPTTGNDSYIILFTNIKNINEQNKEKVILAYMHLDEGQFNSLKKSFNQQIERIRKAEEEKRLKEAMIPIDQLLEGLEGKNNQHIKNGKDSNYPQQTNAPSPSLFN